MLPSSTSLIFFLRSPRKCLKASLAFYRARKRERSAINSAQSPDSLPWSISIAPQRISLKKRYICWANLKSAHFTYYKKKDDLKQNGNKCFMFDDFEIIAPSQAAWMQLEKNIWDKKVCHGDKIQCRRKTRAQMIHCWILSQLRQIHLSSSFFVDGWRITNVLTSKQNLVRW